MLRFLFLCITAIGTVDSYACKCRQLSFSEELAQADQVFTGTVINKTTTDRVYYLFKISQSYKGNATDTLTIQTGLGGGDCGVQFEPGETYLVYANQQQTNSCRRNAPASNNPDVAKLKYLFDPGFNKEIGQNMQPTLTTSEAEYFNAELAEQRGNFDFHGKKAAFVLSGSFIGKQQYFRDWGGREVTNDLILLSEKEREKTHGYDAIIVSWRKQGVGTGFRKKLVKRLAKYKPVAGGFSSKLVATETGYGKAS